MAPERRREPLSIQLIRSRQKTISLEIQRDLTVVLRVPLAMTEGELRRFLQDKDRWIRRHLEQVRAEEAAAQPPFTREEIQEMADQACEVLPKRVAHFAPLVGVDYGRIAIRSQVSRWGSCSSKGNLNFNCLLMRCPPAVQDYVVVHELCHRKQMNHSPAFWAEVERVLPGYRAPKTWLREQGGALIRRLRST